MWRVGIGLTGALVLLANGFLAGLWTNRWHRPVELETGISRLLDVPMMIGDWHARSEELEASVLARAGADGYFLRSYENRLNGKKITVLLMCGRPGPVALHEPDICYRGAGYYQNGAIAVWPQKDGNESTSAEFKRGKFSKSDATDVTSVRLEWSWSAGGRWLAPANPRVAFAHSPLLYKLYVIQTETPSSERSDEETCKDFLEQLLPALDSALFAKK
jgi:Protein of unknown function (DUF3485)